MVTLIELVVTVVCAVAGSSGLWAFLQHRQDKKSDSTKLLLGIAHDRILWLGMHYIEKGYITQDQYENLHDYLYLPYERLGGNGSAKKIVNEIEAKLPIRKE